MDETLWIAQKLKTTQCLESCQTVYDISIGECNGLFDDSTCGGDQTCIDNINAQKTTCVNGEHASRNACYETCN